MTSQNIYNFIATYIDEHGIPPSQREIAKVCYLSLTTVGKGLTVLEARGWIARRRGCARGIQLAKRGE